MFRIEMDSFRPFCLGLLSQTATSIELSWTVESIAKLEIDHFDIRYHIVGEIKWKTIETESNKNSYLVTELRSETPYEFKVRSVLPNGDESQFCDSAAFKTMASLTEKMKKEGTKLRDDTIPCLYKIPLDEVAHQEKNKTRKLRLRTNADNPGKKEKTILVVGATGAGKSTLIDSLINFHLDVAWEEETRFRMIDLTPEEQRKSNETESQTEWITCYELPWMPGCRIDYNLNIIDTPGFGDCRGITRDKEIVGQIKKFFSDSKDHGIEYLDAVWFVTQAPMCRLSPTQRYIFDSILAIFGADIRENIFILITFADGQPPPVLDAIAEAEIPNQGTFTFNNSALFVDASISPNGKVFWKMGKKGFEEFFKDLDTVKTKSLSLTQEVLQIRKQLEDHISRIQKEIIQGTNEQHRMREEERLLILHKRDIADNKNFKYKVREVKVIKIDLDTGVHTTTCLNCNFTCHDNCLYANDDHKMLCWAMDSKFCLSCMLKPEKERIKCSCSTNNHCRICPNHCIWEVHKNQPYVIKSQEVIVEKTYEDMKKKYATARNGKGKAMDIIQKIKEKYDETMESNKLLVAEVKNYINKLKKIALKPNPMSELDYINILIENETEGRKDGYQERIQILKELRGKAALHAQITEELETEGLSQDACRQRAINLKMSTSQYRDIDNNHSDQVDSVKTSPTKQKATDNATTRKSKLCSVM